MYPFYSFFIIFFNPPISKYSDIFTLSVLLQTPLVYVFLGFILFLMELHLHKFIILPDFTYPIKTQCVLEPRARTSASTCRQ